MPYQCHHDNRHALGRDGVPVMADALFHPIIVGVFLVVVAQRSRAIAT
jgi:hypothetical protein